MGLQRQLALWYPWGAGDNLKVSEERSDETVWPKSTNLLFRQCFMMEMEQQIKIQARIPDKTVHKITKSRSSVAVAVRNASKSESKSIPAVVELRAATAKIKMSKIKKMMRTMIEGEDDDEGDVMMSEQKEPGLYLSFSSRPELF